MVEQADPSSSFLLCPRLADDKLVEDGEGSTEKSPAWTRITYAEKGSRYVSAERREKWKCNVDRNGYWKYCDRSVVARVDGGGGVWTRGVRPAVVGDEDKYALLFRGARSGAGVALDHSLRRQEVLDLLSYGGKITVRSPENGRRETTRSTCTHTLSQSGRFWPSIESDTRLATALCIRPFVAFLEEEGDATRVSMCVHITNGGTGNGVPRWTFADIGFRDTSWLTIHNREFRWPTIRTGVSLVGILQGGRAPVHCSSVQFRVRMSNGTDAYTEKKERDDTIHGHMMPYPHPPGRNRPDFSLKSGHETRDTSLKSRVVPEFSRAGRPWRVNMRLFCLVNVPRPPV
jgi:hypothetical protein